MKFQNSGVPATSVGDEKAEFVVMIYNKCKFLSADRCDEVCFDVRYLDKVLIIGD